MCRPPIRRLEPTGQTALNERGIGLGAFAGLDIAGGAFTVWGNEASLRLPNYSWSFLGQASSQDEVTQMVNEVGAVSSTATVNAVGKWAVWGYVTVTS